MPNLPEGSGSITSIPVPAPAAGLPCRFTCPASRRLLLMACRIVLSTDATAAARQINITIAPGGTATICVYSQLTQAASLLQYYFAMAGHAQPAYLTASLVTYGMPPGIILNAGDTLQWNVDNMQAGDTLSNGHITATEWIEP